jgi:glycerate kinase
MKIVVAMDSFKESLEAVAACDAVVRGICEGRGDIEIVTFPMADGGEGTAKALIASCGGEWIARTVTGPLAGMEVEAGFAWFGDEKAALVEMAAASGLELLRHDERNPMMTTTYGTGELIAAAVEYGAEKVYLAVGGSATVDGGTGAARALGWRFVDGRGEELAYGGGQLRDLVRIIPPAAAVGVGVEVLCDVDNPLCGSAGAARVYGPQKGADARMVEELEAGLSNLAEVVEEQLGCEIRDVPGAGAAGGLAGGAVAFMNGKLISGIDFIISRTGIAEALADADWLITGEGRFDEQSLRGKVISGLVAAGRRCGVKVAVLAGQVALGADEYIDKGISCALACTDGGTDLQYAIDNAEELLEAAARRFADEQL